MATKTKRYIDIDIYTRVGYNFLKGKFYVIHKATNTYRDSVEEIQQVLHSLGIHSVSNSEIAALKSDSEVLVNIYYTWEDNGSYIKTLQFNEFKNYPLLIDCTKAKLQILNSNVIYDLNTNESPKIVRVPRLCSFYKDVLGLVIPKDTMLALYNLLVSYYKPTCYNQISLREDTDTPLYYNNNFILSNFDNSSIAVYNCTKNPNAIFNPVNIGNIVNINANTNIITLTEAIPQETIDTYSIKKGTSIIIEGSETIVNEVPYTCDGTYTIADITDNYIKVDGTLPTSYTFSYYTCSVLAYSYTISAINRENNSITLTNTPSNILVGDTIIVEGATITTPYETISCDGTYTVVRIEENSIIVEEEIPTDYTGNATLYKEIFISNINKIENNTIFLTEHTEITLQGSSIVVYNNSIKTKYTVLSQDKSTNTLQVASIEDYTPNYPKLQYPVPSDEIMINVTSVKEEYEDEFPTGEFLLDNFAQVQAYTSTLANRTVPSNVVGDSIGKQVPLTMDVLVSSLTGYTVTLQLIGLFSEIYNSEEYFSKFLQ